LTAGSLLSAIKQAAIVADTETRGVHFVFSEGSIALSSKTADKGQAAISVPAEYSGEQAEVKLDYKYTSAFLQTCESDEVVSVYVGKPSESVLIEDALGALYTVMPMAIER
jgi:DNA polymerase III subunit beta